MLIRRLERSLSFLYNYNGDENENKRHKSKRNIR